MDEAKWWIQGNFYWYRIRFFCGSAESYHCAVVSNLEMHNPKLMLESSQITSDDFVTVCFQMKGMLAQLRLLGFPSHETRLLTQLRLRPLAKVLTIFRVSAAIFLNAAGTREILHQVSQQVYGI
jgi:hypothetical protein